jgi:hypothetical protein
MTTQTGVCEQMLLRRPLTNPPPLTYLRPCVPPRAAAVSRKLCRAMARMPNTTCAPLAPQLRGFVSFSPVVAGAGFPVSSVLLHSVFLV